MLRMKTRSSSASERQRRHSPKPEESTIRKTSSVSKGKSTILKGKSSTPKGKSFAVKKKLSTPEATASTSQDEYTMGEAKPSTSKDECTMGEAKPSTSKIEYTICEVKSSTSKNKSPTHIKKSSEHKAGPTKPRIRSSQKMDSLPRPGISASGSRSSSPGPSTSIFSPKAGPSTFSPKVKMSTSSPRARSCTSSPRASVITSPIAVASTTTYSPIAGPSTSTYSPITESSTSSKVGASTYRERPPSPWAGPSLYKKKACTCKKKSSVTHPPSWRAELSVHESRPHKRKLSPKASPSTFVRPFSTSIVGRSKSRGISMDLTKGAIFMNLLQNREIGSVRSSHFIKSARQMKVEDYKKMRSHKFGTDPRIYSHTVYFVRAGRNALVAAWYAESVRGFTSVISQLHYDINRIEPGTTKFVSSSETIIDACQAYANPDIFVFISCDRSPKGILNIAAPTFDGSDDTVSYSYFHPSEKTFNCLNSNFHTKRFAVGLDGEACIFTVTGLQEMRMFPENIYGLAYNKSGTILHMACESGDFLLYDLRTVNTYQRLNLDSGTLDDVTVLSNENYCLITGRNNKLMKIDLRANKKLFDFQSPYRRSRKIPVSYNANLNLASCTGADNITRIWDLNNGNLMHSFEAESTYPARSCLVPNAFRGQLHLIQDNYIHVYSMLR